MGGQATGSRWWSIGGSLFAGLFVAYLDRTNLSVALPGLSRDMGFAGPGFAVVSSWALTIFLIGYALANVFGGLLTARLDPKPVVIACFATWSVATLLVGLTTSTAVLLACRLVLGIAEGIYWPQQSRFARAWFAPSELSRANGIIQFHGQYLALALGFMVLTPLYQAFGWRVLFFITGGLGLVAIVPLFAALLRPESQSPFGSRPAAVRAPVSLASLGGAPFLLLVFSYVTQGMLFWGITLWIPLIMRSLGFSGWSQAVASALPFAAAIALAAPMARLSDRTGQRVLVASLGLLIPGGLLLVLPMVEGGYARLFLVTLSLGYYASSYTPNIWSILQETVAPDGIGPASGIMNGIGAGGGGTVAGFLVAFLNARTGSYATGFAVLGLLVVLGGLSLLAYGRLAGQRSPVPGVAR